MRKQFIALALVAAILLPARVRASSSPVGVLILAEGTTSHWNKSVKRVVRDAKLEYPTEIFFGLGDNADELRTLQEDIRDLEDDGAHTIIVIPFAVSSYSAVVRQWKYLLGVDVQPGFINNPLFPVEKHATIRFMEPLNESAAVVEILLDRVHEISSQPGKESVLIISAGPADDTDNARWQRTLDILARRLQERGHFKSVDGLTLREDAPAAVRSAALDNVRLHVDAINAAGNRALVVPLLIVPGGIENRIDLELRGHNYVYTAKTLLPDSRLSDWIKSQVP